MKNLNSKKKKKLTKEIILYIIVGLATTLVNFIVYAIANELLKRRISPTHAYKIAYILSFMTAVIFAYWSNKIYVFENKNMKLSHIKHEFISFISARIFSGVVCFLITVLFVDILKFNEYIGWFLSSFFNLAFNYIASKFYIFKV